MSDIQYILDENGNLAEMLKSDAVPVENPIKYRLMNAFEVFVLVDGTENYWISNYGRCVNNLKSQFRNVSEDKFFEHKQGKVHYTIFEIERVHVKDKRGRLTDEIKESRYKRETSPEDLVADTFLKSYRGRCKIWHKDGDYTNNWYKNLLYVSREDYTKLKAGAIKWQDLNYEQEYIEYENKASSEAMKIYSGIRTRCEATEETGNIHKCYINASMWQPWIDEPKLFVKFYLEHYYEVDGESMAVDKDLFGDGSNMYAPHTICILPQGLNTMLSNCKKAYFSEDRNNVLPLGVQKTKADKYRGNIQFSYTGKTIPLSEWNTPEEAFEEYKKMKQADICMVAAHYKGKVPDYIYDKLLTVEVEPY